MLGIVSIDGNSINYSAPTYLDDEELMGKAIDNSSFLMHCASDRLKNSINFVLERLANAKSVSAIQHILENCSTQVRKNPQIYQDAFEFVKSLNDFSESESYEILEIFAKAPSNIQSTREFFLLALDAISCTKYAVKLFKRVSDIYGDDKEIVLKVLTKTQGAAIDYISSALKDDLDIAKLILDIALRHTPLGGLSENMLLKIKNLD